MGSRKAWEQGGGAASFRFLALSSSCGSENQLLLRSGWRDFPSLLSGQQLDCLEPTTMAFNREPELRLGDSILHRGGRERIVIYLWKGSTQSVMLLIITSSCRLLSFVTDIMLCSGHIHAALQNWNYSAGLLVGGENDW